MTTSFSHYPTPDQRGNLASPHAVVEGALKPVWPDTSAATNPAGGIMTNAQDEAKWLMIMADSGRKADGTSLYTTRTARALFAHRNTVLARLTRARELLPLPLAGHGLEVVMDADQVAPALEGQQRVVKLGALRVAG